MEAHRMRESLQSICEQLCDRTTELELLADTAFFDSFGEQRREFWLERFEDLRSRIDRAVEDFTREIYQKGGV